MRTRIPLDPEERGRRIRDIRLRLAPVMGENVTQSRFGELVAEVAGLDRPFNQSTAKRWEEGAEPGFVAGCAIALLGGVAIESLAFEDEPSAAHTPPRGIPVDEAIRELENEERRRRKKRA